MPKDRRASRVGSPSKIPMYVIAGLPPETHTHAISLFRNRYANKAAFIGSPSGTKDGELYSRAFLDTTVRAVGGFALRQRKGDGNSHVNPSAIRLLYVPSQDAEYLLSKLDFIIFPEPLIRLAARDSKGRQLRHNREDVVTAIHDAISLDSANSLNLNHVKERISRVSDRDGITLPPKNFAVSNRADMSLLFKEMRNGTRQWTDRFSELEIRRFSKSDLPDMHGQSVRHVPVDSRGVAFFTAHETAEHGSVYQKDPDASPAEIMNLLQSIYRFGVPVTQGRHYDTQNADATDFKNRTFECSQSGSVSVSNCHANIYLNDYVRAANKRKI